MLRPIIDFTAHNKSKKSMDEREQKNKTPLRPVSTPYRSPRPHRPLRLPGSEDTADNSSNSSTGDVNDGDDKSNSNGDEKAEGNTPETEADGKGKQGARLGEWDVEPVESISEDELSGLYSRISAMREREVEVGFSTCVLWRGCIVTDSTVTGGEFVVVSRDEDRAHWVVQPFSLHHPLSLKGR